VRSIACDEAGRILPEAFAAEMRATSGPAIVILQAGQINTGACDPFADIIPLAKAAGAWVHVDGAFGLWAQASPARAHLTAGVEQADSWGTDGHKWLQTPYDCGFAVVRNEEAHRRAMVISASYLPSAEGAQREPSAYVPELSRRARGFGTWAMIRQLGREGITAMVDQCCAVAEHMARALGGQSGISLVQPAGLNQFMLRFGDGEGDDDLTLATVRQVQEDAVAFIGASQWRGRWVMRVSVSSIATTMADADITVQAVIEAWGKVQASFHSV
jgi:glutamate/tyrosine decarboxylase-like PLP-dependent enzyme